MVTAVLYHSDAMRSTSTGVGGFFLILSCSWANAANPDRAANPSDNLRSNSAWRFRNLVFAPIF
jgi:hypothetical protein